MKVKQKAQQIAKEVVRALKNEPVIATIILIHIITAIILAKDITQKSLFLLGFSTAMFLATFIFSYVNRVDKND